MQDISYVCLAIWDMKQGYKSGRFFENASLEALSLFEVKHRSFVCYLLKTDIFKNVCRSVKIIILYFDILLKTILLFINNVQVDEGTTIDPTLLP